MAKPKTPKKKPTAPSAPTAALARPDPNAGFHTTVKRSELRSGIEQLASMAGMITMMDPKIGDMLAADGNADRLGALVKRGAASKRIALTLDGVDVAWLDIMEG